MSAVQKMKVSDPLEVLFTPTRIGSLELHNRIAMAPMTRAMSPGGEPGEDVARYYRRRAEGGVGLIITEGTFIPHPSAGNDENAPRIYGDDALNGWRRVVEQVHDAEGRIFAQLWHVGLVRKRHVDGVGSLFDDGPVGDNRFSPSGIIGGNDLPLECVGRPATLDEIRGAVAAYGEAARTAKALGFDGVEIHGAHGYLIDQFLWDQTNLRDDEYGGDIGRRTRFATEVVREIRANVGSEFPVVMRLSIWKQQDYSARLADSPEEWAAIVRPLAGAGVDAFHLSQRRYWEGAFGTEANLATWTKKLTGKPTITVGSITLGNSMLEMMRGEGSLPENNLAPLLAGLERGDFDLVAVGRALIANPDWPHRVRNGTPLVPYSLNMLQTLV
jgi:2,4-dienoyl-CoA reductase-like NADH-dependent reductase (Old Yellow Enzyme family)